MCSVFLVYTWLICDHPGGRHHGSGVRPAVPRVWCTRSTGGNVGAPGSSWHVLQGSPGSSAPPGCLLAPRGHCGHPGSLLAPPDPGGASREPGVPRESPGVAHAVLGGEPPHTRAGHINPTSGGAVCRPSQRIAPHVHSRLKSTKNTTITNEL